MLAVLAVLAAKVFVDTEPQNFEDFQSYTIRILQVFVLLQPEFCRHCPIYNSNFAEKAQLEV